MIDESIRNGYIIGAVLITVGLIAFAVAIVGAVVTARQSRRRRMESIVSDVAQRQRDNDNWGALDIERWGRGRF